MSPDVELAPPRGIDERVDEGSPAFSKSAAWSLFVGCVTHAPAIVYAGWHDEIARPYRLAVAALLAAGGVLLITRVLAGRTRPFHDVLVGVSISWWTITVGGAATEQLSGGESMVGVLGLALAAIAGLTAYRLRTNPIARSGAAVLATILIGSPLLSIVTRVVSDAPQTLQASRPVIDSPPQSTSDVWVLVLDTYPSSAALRNLYNWPEGGLAPALVSKSFHTNGDALSAYSMTILSVPSILEGAHVADVGSLGQSQMGEIRRRMSGDNFLVKSLKASGYEVTVVENGWRLLGCGENVDTCVPSPVLDESIGLLLGRSVIGRMVGIARESFVAEGVSHTMNWAKLNAAKVSSNGKPDLIYLHLMIPHSPMQFDATCARHPMTSSNRGFAVGTPNLPTGVLLARRQLFTDQVACVTTFVFGLVDDLDPHDIVAIVGDHGPDSFGQTELQFTDWSAEMVAERMLTLAAVRLPDGCEADLRTTLGVTPAVLGCVLNRDMSVEPANSFLVSHDISSEGAVGLIDSHEVERLLSMSEGD